MIYCLLRKVFHDNIHKIADILHNKVDIQKYEQIAKYLVFT